MKKFLLILMSMLLIGGAGRVFADSDPASPLVDLPYDHNYRNGSVMFGWNDVLSKWVAVRVSATGYVINQSNESAITYSTEDTTVLVGTKTAVMVGGYAPNRIYYSVQNLTSGYSVVHATWAITQADIQKTDTATGVSKGFILAPYLNTSGLSNWEDTFQVYKSSWYVLLSSANALSDVTAVTGTVNLRERK